MKCNVGGIDRISRILIGIVLLIVGFAAPFEMILRVAILAVAAIALVTAAVRFCPVNAALGLNTCESVAKKQ